MHPHLERCRQGIRTAIEGLSPQDADAAPAGKWSIAGIVEHLDLAFSLNARALERRLAAGVPKASRATWVQRIGRLLIVQFRYFPPGRESPAGVVPTGRPLADVARDLDAHLAALDQRLTECERTFGPRRRIMDHPVLGPFSVADWRRFHWIHTRHHLRQIAMRRRSSA